ncbi:MAG: 4'-phosphopantetheinyl transferase superfamily protein [Moraxellaceae bacterium]|nr:4'-phosphopantetheinyl transferase superfamily protein [Moraxellaceae bacterium]
MATDTSAVHDAVHVWFFEVPQAGGDGDAALHEWSALLDADERQHAERLRRPADRCLYIAAHGLLRQLLGHFSGEPPASLRFSRCANGKPRPVQTQQPYREPALHFNLSHSHRGVAVALSAAGEVGVDIERIQPGLDIDSLAPLTLHRDEQRQLGMLDPTARSTAFFRAWTCKEAWLKAQGVGLSGSLTSLSVVAVAPGISDNANASRTTILRDAAGNHWPIATHRIVLAGEPYALAVAAPALPHLPVVWHSTLPAAISATPA